jgi:hypothetical protein
MMTYLALSLYLSGVVLVFSTVAMGNTSKHGNGIKFLTVIFWPLLSVILAVLWVIE